MERLQRLAVRVLLFAVCFAPFAAFALDPASLPAGAPTLDLPLDEALKMLIASLGGLKGAGAMTIAVVVVQGVLYFFRTKLASFAGKWQLLVVYALNLVVVGLTLLAGGVPILAAFTHTNTATAFQVLLNQVIKQVTEKPDTQA